MLNTDQIRLEANQQLDSERKVELGQFMTPDATADFMAGLFGEPSGPVRLLDPGAGVGSLSIAFARAFPKASVAAECWELDPVMRRHLVPSLEAIASHATGFRYSVRAEDFIEGAATELISRKMPRYTHAILNPPYAKINSQSRHRLVLRAIGVETVNLYSGFLALTILAMEKGGQIVAIIPRSFCNGAYFKPFRALMFRECALRHIHVFESRKKVFKDDAVLQENVIVRLDRGVPQGDVVVSSSAGLDFAGCPSRSVPFASIVKPDDEDLFIHIPSAKEVSPPAFSPLCAGMLKEIGLEVSTGPVVDFRMTEDVRKEPEPGTVPLLYAHHFKKGVLSWPDLEHRKPNAIRVSGASRRWLMPSGIYVLVKRFSSKEERRRITAYVLEPSDLPGELIGIENHWNVFHIGKAGLDFELACGLAAFLNCTATDEAFRVFSGHTQVNAGDLRKMAFPDRETLRKLGRKAGKGPHSQETVDALISEMEYADD
jgi:adenine-specific DNA-methyltransferase